MSRPHVIRQASKLRPTGRGLRLTGGRRWEPLPPSQPDYIWQPVNVPDVAASLRRGSSALGTLVLFCGSLILLACYLLGP